jgi:RNA polymerase primary sigma factor
VIDIRRADQTPSSLDQKVGESEETSLGDLIARDEPGPAEAVAGEASGRAVQEAVNALPEAERDVLRLRFGLAGEEPAPLREAGKKLGISPERVRQLEDRALRRLSRDDDLAALREAA